LQQACTATGHDQHYPISQAGVWVDCFHQRQPVIHNDYASLPHRKELPEGHPPLVRELTVPVLAQGRITAIIGVGNKPEDYTADDVEGLQQLSSLLMDVVERKRSEERITHLAYHDALTQLPNRVLLTDRLQQGMAQARRDQWRLAVCYLDLDGFKLINDTWGHEQGDQVLISVARRLKECVRAGDTVARLGGDEFALLLVNLASVEECERTLDRVMAALKIPFVIESQAVQLGASLGVTLYPDDQGDPDALLRHVDQAMYDAKQAWGCRYQWFDAVHDRRAREYRTLLQQIQDGLEANEFCLYYQPKVDMRRGVVIGLEALIRWQRPEEGLLPPARFMPVVENSDLAVMIDQWVLNEALRQMTLWASQGVDVPVSVNLSGRYLQKPNFTNRLQMLIAKYPAALVNGLILEILETAAFEDMQKVSRLITDGQSLGVRFALDDFGTGYSSLTYLKNLPVEILKIDQSFVRDLLTDAEARAIVEGVIGLSRAFRRMVIAEGVETAEHGRLLLDLGCNLAQGYGIARPMPPEQVPDWIACWRPPDAWVSVVDLM
jgi:diguanylate cyclase (GGDEF)-like protein